MNTGLAVGIDFGMTGVFPKTIGSEALRSTEIRGAINRLEYSPRVCRRNFAYRSI